MDKTEYQEKLEQLKEFVRIKDYKQACSLADGIDWKRVKSIRTLNMVADVYEANKEYDKCRQVLSIAFSRSSIGKSILYRLAEVCIKQKDISAAQEYYEKFSKLAPGDNNRLLLEYRLGKANNMPIEEQIRLLEEYKDREYTERWAYELAQLYSKAGDTKKCVDACDDMILWFSEGRYVLKAMELKKKYAPLTSSQQFYYDKEQRDADARLLFQKEETPEIPVPRTNTGTAVLDRMNTAGAAVTKDVNIDMTQPLPVTGAEMDSIPVTSNTFMGGKPDLKKQLEKSIQNVYAGVKEAPKVESNPIQINTAEFNLDAFLKETQEGFSSAAATDAKEQPEVQEQPEAQPEEAAEEAVQAEKAAAEAAQAEEAALAAFAASLKEDTAGEAPVQTAPEMPEALQPEEEPEAVQPEEATEVPETLQPEEEPEAVQPEEATEVPETLQLEEAVKAVSGAAQPKEAENVAEAVQEAFAALQKEEPAAAHAPVLDDREIPDPEPTPEEKLTRTIPLGKVGQNTVPISIEEILRAETPEERRIRILNNAVPTKMSDEQRQIFTYFARIPGMDSQILEAMTGVYEHVGDHTSKKGNIAVMGASGTGKSRLSDGLILAMCKDMQLEVAKTARVTGERMNSLDPAKVVSQMAGGFLIIENASDMTSLTVEKLSRAMEFRTDRMILIIEDDKTPMRAFLKKYPEFTEKFSGTISIPVFTNDELVTFARTYCAENNCQMDELAVLALYSIISNGQSEEQPMTISEVKEILDTAMSKAKRGGRRGRKSSSKSKTVILYEKDFF